MYWYEFNSYVLAICWNYGLFLLKNNEKYLVFEMKKLVFCVGLVAELPGGLWLLQGLGLVNIRPTLCLADCVPIQGPSTAWAFIGAIVLAEGCAAVCWSFMRRAE